MMVYEGAAYLDTLAKIPESYDPVNWTGIETQSRQSKCVRHVLSFSRMYLVGNNTKQTLLPASRSPLSGCVCWFRF